MPSKKVFATLVICIGIIVSVFIVNKKSNTGVSSGTLSQKNSIEGIEIVQKQPEIDTDGDGLYDWQETLIGTDPNKKDTDGDGTIDGEEITLGRDPRKKGPNDKDATIGTIITNKTSTVTYEGEGTMTDEIAKDFFAKYLLLKKNGQEVSAEEASRIAESTLTSADYTKTTGVLYTKSNIQISNDTSKTAIDAYGTNLSESLKKRSPKKSENELVILGRAIENEKTTELQKLDPIIQGYKGIISDLVTMPVPKDAVDLHLAYLNACSNVLADIEAMRVAFVDPVRAFAHLSQYKQHAQDLAVSLQKFDKYFNK